MTKPKTTKSRQSASRRSKAAPAAATELKTPAPSKLDVLIGLLSRPQGATVAELSAATAWQAHSVRGAIAGSIKKGRGLQVGSELTPRGRVYSIVVAGE